MKRWLFEHKIHLLTAAALGTVLFFLLRFFSVPAARSALAAPVCAGVALMTLSGIFLLIKSVRRGECVSRRPAFFVSLVLFGLAFSLALPPFLSPDEQTHYATAYRYANLLLGETGPDDATLSSSIGLNECRITFRGEDAALLDALGATQADYASVWQPMIDHWSFQSDGSAAVASTRITYPYPATGYLFSAAGLALGRLLGLGSLPTLLLARILNLLAGAAILALSCRRTPALSRLLAVTAMLPMTLNLVSSLSPDGLLIALALLAFSELMRLLFSERQLSARDLSLIALLFFIVCPLKIHCAPLALTALAIGPRRFTSRRQYLLGVFGVIAIAVCACLLANWNAVQNVLSDTGAYVSEGYSLSFILKNPLTALALIGRTFFVQLPALALCLAGHLLGQLNVALPSYFYTLLYLLLLVFSALRVNGERTLPAKNSWLFFAMSALTVLAAYAVMLVWWTDAGSPLIVGVQGRYFLPAIPFALTVFYGKRALPFESTNACVCAAALLNVFSALWCCFAVIAA